MLLGIITFLIILSSIKQENLSAIAEKPESEFQTRPLTLLDNPQDQQEAWQQAVKPTAKQVKQAV